MQRSSYILKFLLHKNSKNSKLEVIKCFPYGITSRQPRYSTIAERNIISGRFFTVCPDLASKGLCRLHSQMKSLLVGLFYKGYGLQVSVYPRFPVGTQRRKTENSSKPPKVGGDTHHGSAETGTRCH